MYRQTERQADREGGRQMGARQTNREKAGQPDNKKNRQTDGYRQ